MHCLSTCHGFMIWPVVCLCVLFFWFYCVTHMLTRAVGHLVFLIFFLLFDSLKDFLAVLASLWYCVPGYCILRQFDVVFSGIWLAPCVLVCSCAPSHTCSPSSPLALPACPCVVPPVRYYLSSLLCI